MDGSEGTTESVGGTRKTGGGGGAGRSSVGWQGRLLVFGASTPGPSLGHCLFILRTPLVPPPHALGLLTLSPSSAPHPLPKLLQQPLPASSLSLGNASLML